MATNNAANYSPTQYDVLVGGASGAIASITNGTTGQVLTANTGANPSWGSAGVGTVTSVSGTANQIDVATGTTTPVISLDSSITCPGSLTTTTTLTSTTMFKTLAGITVERTAVIYSSNNYTVLTTDYILAVTTTSAANKITFPSTPTVGQVWIIKDESGGAATNNIELYAGGTTTIDGLTAQYINTNYGSVTIYAGTTSAYFLI